MNKSNKLTSISIILLAIGQILINIRMSSYREDMNSLWKLQIEINRDFCNHIDSFLVLQESFLDFLNSSEHNLQSY